MYPLQRVDLLWCLRCIGTSSPTRIRVLVNSFHAIRVFFGHQDRSISWLNRKVIGIRKMVFSFIEYIEYLKNLKSNFKYLHLSIYFCFFSMLPRVWSKLSETPCRKKQKNNIRSDEFFFPFVFFVSFLSTLNARSSTHGPPKRFYTRQLDDKGIKSGPHYVTARLLFASLRN